MQHTYANGIIKKFPRQSRVADASRFFQKPCLNNPLPAPPDADDWVMVLEREK